MVCSWYDSSGLQTIVYTADGRRPVARRCAKKGSLPPGRPTAIITGNPNAFAKNNDAAVYKTETVTLPNSREKSHGRNA
jgi:hypothetical protein